MSSINSEKLGKLIQRLAQWRQAHVPVGVALMALAIITGIGAGVGAWVLKFTIGHASRLIVSNLREDGLNFFILLLPFAGILLTVVYQRYVVHSSLEHGADQISRALAEKRYRIRRGMCYQPIMAAIMTLSFGGSAGAEGPIATAGAALGSNLAKLFGVSPDMMRILVGCGAGAGIGGIFKAPVGGMLYTLEVMKMRMTTLSVLALVLAAICGAMTCYVLTGYTFDVQFLPTSFFDPKYLGWICLFGIFCGVYSVYYNKVTTFLHGFFGRFKNHWYKNLVSAGILSASLFLFPSLYGEGYGIVTDLVNSRTASVLQGSIFATIGTTGWWLVGFALILLLVKVWATISTNSGGGVAGDFAPTIFAGAVAGLVFARAMNLAFDADIPEALFALLGTAGAFSGIIHAPLMATFLVSEMVGNGYGYILPLFLVAMISYLTVKFLTPGSKYVNGNHDDLEALIQAQAPQKNDDSVA